MPARDAQALARDCVPGGGAVLLERVGAGLISESYRVERDGVRFALRLRLFESALGGAAPARWECAVLRRAAAAKLAPALDYCDPEEGVQVTRWIPGRSWNRGEVTSPENVERFAHLLRRIHALPVPVPRHGVSPRDWITQYRGALAAEHQEVPPGLRSAASAADATLDALARGAAGAAVLCHGDLHPLNLIDGAHGLMVLDWEYAHVSEPFWDLAVWSAANDLDGPARSMLLEAYVGRPATPAERERFEGLAWIYDYTCLLWNTVYAMRRPGAPPPIAATRCELLTARLSHRFVPPAGGRDPQVTANYGPSDQSPPGEVPYGELNGADDGGGS